jgi:hypothetical protein
MLTLFVYYKVPVGEHAHCLALVNKFEQALQLKWPALEMEIAQRPIPSAEGLETWMEIYKHPGGLTEEIMASIAQLATDLGLPSKRASEVFIQLRR